MSKPNDFSLAAAKSLTEGQTLWDRGAGAVTGLHLMQRSGRRTWYFYHRDAKGRQRKPKVGEFAMMNLSEARAKCQAILKAPVSTDAPSGARTIKDLIALYLRFKRDIPEGKKRKKENSLLEDERIFKRHVIPAFGDREAESLTIDDLTRWHNSKSSTRYEANRCRDVMQHLFNLAIKQRWIPPIANPAAGVQRFLEKPRHRPATPDELKRIFEAIDFYAGKHPRQALAFRLLINTGARCGEITSARMNDIQRQADGSGRIVLTEHKTEATGEDRIIFLSAEDLKRIDAAQPIGGRKDALVIGVRSIKEAWIKVRDRAGCPDLRIHDLRHSFISVGLMNGINMQALSLMLGHRSQMTTRRYAKLFDTQGDEVARLVSNATAKFESTADTKGPTS